MLAEKKVNEFVQEVSSDSPAPGGGSVSALSSALGAALGEMACRISLKKSENAELVQLAEEEAACKKRLVELVDEDTQAFDKVMEAFKLPKATDEEKEVRKKAVQDAFKQAALVPLEVMQVSLKALKACEKIAGIASDNVASDVGVAVLATETGLRGASFNVRINLSAIKDEEFKGKTRSECAEIEAEAKQIKEKTLAAIEAKL